MRMRMRWEQAGSGWKEGAAAVSENRNWPDGGLFRNLAFASSSASAEP